jgi:hypothetical protein
VETFLQDIGTKVVISLAALAVVRILLLSVKAIRNRIIESHSGFELSGYWMATYKDLRTPESNAEHREIVRLKQTGEAISCLYEHHNSEDSLVTRGDGQGFVRANEIYMYYRRQNKGRGSGGVLILRIELTSIRLLYLDGVFIERNRVNTCGQTISVPYPLTPVEVPFKNQLRMLCRKQAFKNFAEIARLEAGSKESKP